MKSPFDFESLITNASRLKEMLGNTEELLHNKEVLEKITATGSAGVDAVKVTLNGLGNCTAIDFKENLFEEESLPVITGLLIAAINNANVELKKTSQKDSTQNMEKLFQSLFEKTTQK